MCVRVPPLLPVLLRTGITAVGGEHVIKNARVCAKMLLMKTVLAGTEGRQLEVAHLTLHELATRRPVAPIANGDEMRDGEGIKDVRPWNCGVRARGSEDCLPCSKLMHKAVRPKGRVKKARFASCDPPHACVLAEKAATEIHQPKLSHRFTRH